MAAGLVSVVLIDEAVNEDDGEDVDEDDDDGARPSSSWATAGSTSAWCCLICFAMSSS